ncbi:MAG: glycosyltransferase family 2 protein [Pseudogulbenkiania sp.]|nr:glycosyltransferase family 2 protein [Pseudogulbenkiania sp.]
MSEVLLSICIPTFNRAKFLNRLLTGLMPQVDALGGIVNVYISDNASDDTTHVDCQSWSEKSGVFKFQRNECNFGPDFNISRAFDLADGKYVWVLGDDEVIAPGALKPLIDLLCDNDVGLVCLRTSEIPSDGDVPAMSHLKAIRIDSPEVLASKVRMFFTFISGVIINKLLYAEKCAEDRSGLLGTYLIQLGWVLPVLVSGKQHLYIASPIVAAEQNNTGGYKLFTVFGENFVRLVKQYLVEHPSIQKILINAAMLFLIDWRFKSLGKFSTENITLSMDRAFGELLPYRAVVRPLFFSNLITDHFFFYCYRTARSTLVGVKQAIHR